MTGGKKDLCIISDGIGSFQLVATPISMVLYSPKTIYTWKHGGIHKNIGGADLYFISLYLTTHIIMPYNFS